MAEPTNWPPVQDYDPNTGPRKLMPFLVCKKLQKWASNPQFWARVCTFHRSDTLQDLTTHKGSLMLPVHLSTRLLVARKSIELKRRKKGSAHDFPKMEAL